MKKKEFYSKMGNILVFGADGYMGRFYLKIMLKELGYEQEQIIAIENDESKLLKIKKQYPRICTYLFTNTPLLRSHKAKHAFVLVNTPNHLRVLRKCSILGIKNIFIEKPLVYSASELKDVKKLSFDKFYVGYLINGAKIVEELNSFISKKKLAVSFANARWGKNFCPVKRTIGSNAKEEMTHPLGLITSVVDITNGGIKSSSLKLHCTYNPYIQPSFLKKAKQQGITYANKLNDSSSGVLEMKTKTTGSVFSHITSSFNLFKQVRQVEFVLVRKDDPTKFPAYKALLDFDELFGRAKKRRADRIQIIEAKTDKIVFELISHDNKLKNQIENVFSAFCGEQPDKRLVDLKRASELVRLLDKALEK